jgi:hypothetical protein
MSPAAGQLGGWFPGKTDEKGRRKFKAAAAAAPKKPSNLKRSNYATALDKYFSTSGVYSPT